MESNDKMRMTILHPGLKLGVFVTWRDVSAMTGEAVLEEIMKVLQSNENFRIIDGQMTIQVTVVRLPVGSGRKPLHAGLYFESENMSINKRSIIQINNTKDVMLHSFLHLCQAKSIWEISQSHMQKLIRIKECNTSYFHSKYSISIHDHFRFHCTIF